jgi:diguanylate cyclase (GGDEF)-like protein
MTVVKTITVYGDFNCPFCYALNERLQVYAREFFIRWRSVQHLPIANGKIPSIQEHAQLTSEVAAVRKRAPEVQIVTPASRPNTSLANQVLLTAELRGDSVTVLRSLIFQALWCEGKDISDVSVLTELVVAAGLTPIESVAEVFEILVDNQQVWELGDYDRRVPSMENDAGGRILGFPAIPRLMPFLQGQVEEDIRSNMGSEMAPRRRVLAVGANIGLMAPVANEFAIDQASFDDDLAMLALEAGHADLIILDGSDERHRSLCLRLQAAAMTQHIPVVIYNQQANARQEVEAFDMGALDYMHGDQDPVVWLARSKGLARHKRSTDLLGKLARIDGLTEIPNRREFDRVLEIEWLRAIRSQDPLSLLMLDVDNFKAYNDGYGHDAGDECLRQVALTIQTTMRRSPDFAARYGGEEFVCVLPETDVAGAVALANDIRVNIEALNIPHGYANGDRILTVSAGVATLTASAQKSPVELIKAADGALYQAKQAGRNCIIEAA